MDNWNTIALCCCGPNQRPTCRSRPPGHVAAALLVESCGTPLSGCIVAAPAGSVRVITRPLAPANQRGQHGSISASVQEGMPVNPSALNGSLMYISGGSLVGLGSDSCAAATPTKQTVSTNAPARTQPLAIPLDRMRLIGIRGTKRLGKHDSKEGPSNGPGCGRFWKSRSGVKAALSRHSQHNRSV